MRKDSEDVFLTGHHKLAVFLVTRAKDGWSQKKKKRQRDVCVDSGFESWDPFQPLPRFPLMMYRPQDLY